MEAGAGAGAGAGGRLGFGLGAAGPGVKGVGGVEVAAGGGVSVAEGAAAGGVAGCGSRLSGGGTTAAMVVGRVLAQPPSRRWLVWVRVRAYRLGDEGPFVFFFSSWPSQAFKH